MAKIRTQIEEHTATLWQNPQQFVYPHKKFAALRHLETDTSYFPAGPGARCYDFFGDVTAKRRTGSDPGFPAQIGSIDGMEIDGPENIPQEIITAYRSAFHDGLKMWYPDPLVRAFLNKRLAETKPFKMSDQFIAGATKKMGQLLPRIQSLNTQPKKGGRRFSLEHEARKSFCPHAQRADFLEIRHDRKQFTTASQYHTYKLYEKCPELWAAFLLTQIQLQEYNSEILGANQQYFDAHIKDSATNISLAKHLPEALPATFLFEFFKNSIKVENVPFFFGAAALAIAEQERGERAPQEITLEDITRGIRASETAGVFRSKFKSPYGERRVICPISTTLTGWMRMDMDGSNTPEGTAIGKFYTRTLKEMPTNTDLQKLCQAIKGTMTQILNDSDQNLIARIQKADAQSAPASDGAAPE